LTSFIGREREMEETRRLVTSQPLVTLLGAGGTGKTRLSLQIGADLLEQFPDGVWFVELAPLTDTALIGQTMWRGFPTGRIRNRGKTRPCARRRCWERPKRFGYCSRRHCHRSGARTRMPWWQRFGRWSAGTLRRGVVEGAGHDAGAGRRVCPSRS